MSVRSSFGALFALAVVGCGCGTVTAGAPRALDEVLDGGCGTAAGPPDASPDVGPVPARGFRLRASSLRVEALRGGHVEIAVWVERASGFRTPIVVQAFGLPEGTEAEPIGVANEAELLVVGADGLAPDAIDAPFAIHGSAGGYRDTLRATLSVVGAPVVEE
jgi:hypothetical protein